MVEKAKPLSPAFIEAMGLVRQGMGLDDAARLTGVTRSALKSACLKNNVAFPTSQTRRKIDLRRRQAIKHRNAEVLRRFKDGQPLEAIMQWSGLTAYGVQRVLLKTGHSISIPPRQITRSSLREGADRRTARAVEAYIDARGTPMEMSIYAVSQAFRVSVYRLTHAVKVRLRQLDKSDPASDTKSARRMT